MLSTEKENPFKALMQDWNELAPYNALHILKFDAKPDIGRWQLAINTVTGALFDNKSPIIIDRYFEQDINKTISHHLNTTFAEESHPLRFFIQWESECYYFGLCYGHWLADSYAIRAMAVQIYLHYQQAVQTTPLQIESPGLSQLFPKMLGRKNFFKMQWSLIRNYFYYASAYRTPMKNAADFSCAFAQYQLPDALFGKIKAASESTGITLNDYFIAAISAAIGGYWQSHRDQFRRRWIRKGRCQIAIGVIADLRQQAQENLKTCFGQYFGTYTVITDKPEQQDAQQLLQKIHHQTQKHKAKNTAVKSYWSWLSALKLWRDTPKHSSKARMYIKCSPIMAGISNVNLDKCQQVAALKAEGLQNYIRVSPTGPLLPLVLTFSTFENQLNLAITYRLTAYDRAAIDTLMQVFIDNLMQLS